ncbi:unnamed protein product [Arctogadus glacialis]
MVKTPAASSKEPLSAPLVGHRPAGPEEPEADTTPTCRECSAWDTFTAAMPLHNMSHDDSKRKSLVRRRSAGCSTLTQRTKDLGRRPDKVSWE